MHLFLFFRDFRLVDNLGLIATLKKYQQVVPAFVFTPQQINPALNPYFADHSVQFLCEGLRDLASQIKAKQGALYIFHGELLKVLSQIHEVHPISSLTFNIDYTPYAKKRTMSLRHWTKQNNIAIHLYEDYLLAPVGSFLQYEQKPYHIYTFFKKKVYEKEDMIDVVNTFSSFRFEKAPALARLCYPIEKLKNFYKANAHARLQGGRSAGMGLLANLPRAYSEKRNDLTFATSHLAAYIKYGALSVREVFHTLKAHGDLSLQDQLIWREFYTYIAYYFPEVLQGAYWQKKYEKIAWLDDSEALRAWQKGQTGYPIVDACMRELNATGYMHNRGRLITANFLNRLLHIDWRRGERYFAQMLIDYDPAINNGNWQWVASTGVDPKPYFQRLFNPFLQSKKFDPHAVYMKKWLPELAYLPADHLHEWSSFYRLYNLKKINYYAPIVDYKSARQRSLDAYKLA
ncbi:MAG: deoxyribodipyrimidine photo-lyase [Bacteroidota bacterium]